MTDTTVSHESATPCPVMHCSFCGKSQNEVRKMIAGPGPTLCICDECIDLCVYRIIDDSDFQIVKDAVLYAARTLFDLHGKELPHHLESSGFMEGMKKLTLAIDPDFFIKARQAANKP